MITLDITERKDAATAIKRLVNNMMSGDMLIYRVGPSNWTDKRPPIMIAARDLQERGKVRLFQKRINENYVYYAKVV